MVAALADGVGKDHLGIPAGTPDGKIGYAYVRVSSPAQVGEDRTGLPRELMRIDQYRIQQDLHVPLAHVFGDDFTGRDDTRPSSDMLMQALSVAPAQWRTLVVEGVDRLGRNYGVSWLLTRQLQRLGVSVRFLKEMGAIEQMAWAMAAEIEVQQIGARRRFRNLVKIRQGELASYYPRFGYAIVNDRGHRSFVVHEQNAEVVRLVFALYARLGTLKRVQKELHRTGVPSPRGSSVWAVSSLRLLLEDETYIGRHYQNRLITQLLGGYTRSGRARERTSLRPAEEWSAIAVPPLVERELFLSIQETLHNTHKCGPLVLRTLLRGMLRCGNCGRAMVRGGGLGRQSHYHCPRRSSNEVARNSKMRCDQRDILVDQLDGQIWAFITEVLLDAAAFLAVLQAQRGIKTGGYSRDRLHKRLRQSEYALQKATASLAQHYLGPSPADRLRPNAADVLAKLRAERDRRAREFADSQPPTANDLPTVEELSARLTRFDRSAVALEERRRVVEQLIDEVTVGSEGTTLRVAGRLHIGASHPGARNDERLHWAIELPFARPHPIRPIRPRPERSRGRR